MADEDKPSVFGESTGDEVVDVTDVDGEPTHNIDTDEIRGVEDPTQVDTDESAPSSSTPPGEEPTQASSGDTGAEPADGSVESDQQPEAEIDWQKRYGDLFRTHQERAAREAALEAQNQQYQEAIARVLPVIEQMRRQAAQKPKPTPDELVAKGIDPDLYAQVEPLIEERLAEQAQQFGSAIEQERAAASMRASEEAKARYNAEVYATAHSYMEEKNIEVGSDLDTGVGTFIQELHGAMVGAGMVNPQTMEGALDLTDRGLYDLAYEAVQSPTFAAKLLANPRTIDDDRAIALARREAALLDGVQAATTQGERVKQPLPTVTRAGGGGNPQGRPRATEDDPLADAKELVATERGSAFG